jgi:hypothetical protein
MAVKAYFDIDAQGLSVTFTNLSIESDAWAWDFGFAPNGTSNVQNPGTIIFPEDGKYHVKLTAINNAGPAQDVFEMDFIFTAANRLNLTIRDLVKFLSPSTLDVTTIQYSQYIKKWQLYLQPIVTDYATIADADVFKEWKWPNLLNQFISKLVIWDSILDSARKAALSSQGSTKGAVKSIEQGPTKASWYDGLAFMEGLLKNDGYFRQLNEEICMIGQQVGVTLPMCPNTTFVGFIVGKKCTPQIIWPDAFRERGLPGF